MSGTTSTNSALKHQPLPLSSALLSFNTRFLGVLLGILTQPSSANALPSITKVELQNMTNQECKERQHDRGGTDISKLLKRKYIK